MFRNNYDNDTVTLYAIALVVPLRLVVTPLVG